MQNFAVINGVNTPDPNNGANPDIVDGAYAPCTSSPVNGKVFLDDVPCWPGNAALNINNDAGISSGYTEFSYHGTFTTWVAIKGGAQPRISNSPDWSVQFTIFKAPIGYPDVWMPQANHTP